MSLSSPISSPHSSNVVVSSQSLLTTHLWEVACQTYCGRLRRHLWHVREHTAIRTHQSSRFTNYYYYYQSSRFTNYYHQSSRFTNYYNQSSRFTYYLCVCVHHAMLGHSISTIQTFFIIADFSKYIQCFQSRE